MGRATAFALAGHGACWTWRLLDMALAGHGACWTWRLLDMALAGHGAADMKNAAGAIRGGHHAFRTDANDTIDLGFGGFSYRSRPKPPTRHSAPAMPTPRSTRCVSRCRARTAPAAPVVRAGRRNAASTSTGVCRSRPAPRRPSASPAPSSCAAVADERRGERPALRRLLLRRDELAIDQALGDLDCVEGGALAQVVGHHP